MCLPRTPSLSSTPSMVGALTAPAERQEFEIFEESVTSLPESPTSRADWPRSRADSALHPSPDEGNFSEDQSEEEEGEIKNNNNTVVEKVSGKEAKNKYIATHKFDIFYFYF